jgi:protein-L-isoaspartate(D-aspartate) O-methyltransferase
MHWSDQRRRMVDDQLRRRGITDARVLAAMADVPRERFVPPEQIDQACADRALPIACDQTISQPLIVALMTEALQLSDQHRVLEIGTGSGYQAAVLCHLAAVVTTIERYGELSRSAEKILRELGCENVTCLVGDGSLGWPDGAPYDRILVTAAAEQIPPALIAQLADGGRLVMPVGPSGDQMLQAIDKHAGRTQVTTHGRCRFVPLVGEQGWPGEP